MNQTLKIPSMIWFFIALFVICFVILHKLTGIDSGFPSTPENNKKVVILLIIALSSGSMAMCSSSNTKTDPKKDTATQKTEVLRA